MEYLTDEDYVTAKFNGINRGALKYRFYTSGWAKKLAINEPLRGLTFKDLDQKQTKELVALAESNGISKDTLYWRIKRAKPPWSLEDAATRPIDVKRRRKKSEAIPSAHESSLCSSSHCAIQEGRMTSS